jgi:3-deoxy-D-manno-octulosonate 8-phosphate phosphatase (KDO 8-P phosphatase)
MSTYATSDFPYEILITDVDGVLTDGSYQYSKKGKISKTFGPHDADGFKMFNRVGVQVVAISADKRGFPITKKRLTDMGVPLYLVSESERSTWVQEKSQGRKYGFIGDGYYDIQTLINADIGYAPLNAPELVKANANMIIPVFGGNGVILHVFDHFLSIVNEDSHRMFRMGKF